MVKKILSWFAGSREINIEPIYKTREVWVYTHIDPVTRRTSEKPVLIFRKASDGMFWGLPLTATRAKGKTIYVPRLKNGRKVSPLAQMRTLKAERLVKRLGEASEKEFNALRSIVVRRLAEAVPTKKPVRVEQTYRVRTQATPIRYQRALPSPLSSPFAPVYILQPR